MMISCRKRVLWVPTILTALLFAVALPSQAAAACRDLGSELVAFATDGIGGTGRGDPEDGVGGTGREPNDPVDGMGGTGRERSELADGIGGTGMFGTLTGFGSLCVNGHEIVLDPETPVTLAGEQASTNVLRVGQVVWLIAEEQEGALYATQVDVFLAAAGPIEQIELSGRALRVAGHRVVLLEGGLLVDGASGMPLAFESLRVGETLAVSGLENAEGVVLASRIERRERSWPPVALPDPAELARRAGLSRVSVEGYLRRGPEGQLQVGSFPLALAAGSSQAAALATDTRVWVQGRSDGARLTVEQIRLPAPTPAPRPRPGRPPGARVDPPRTLLQPQYRGDLRQLPAPPQAPRPAPQARPDRPRKLDVDRIRRAPIDSRVLQTR